MFCFYQRIEEIMKRTRKTDQTDFKASLRTCYTAFYTVLRHLYYFKVAYVFCVFLRVMKTFLMKMEMKLRTKLTVKIRVSGFSR